VQGEYSGEINAGGDVVKIGVQVIALGEGNLRAVSYIGGLPGDGWDGIACFQADGMFQDAKATFTGDQGHGAIVDGVLAITTPTGEEMGKLKKVQRESPTLGKEPPEEAIVLFDGKDVDQWQDVR
jgi:hypothetical protein